MKQRIRLTVIRIYKCLIFIINHKATLIQHLFAMKTITFPGNAKVNVSRFFLAKALFSKEKCIEVLFGGYLETYALEHNRTVPLIVVKCCEAIENMGGLQKEGIYRISGRQANVEQLKHQFELDEEAITLDGYDVFTIATALKLFLRELKYPLFDFVAQSRATYNSTVYSFDL